jgi:hypothetical protein
MQEQANQDKYRTRPDIHPTEQESYNYDACYRLTVDCEFTDSLGKTATFPVGTKCKVLATRSKWDRNGQIIEGIVPQTGDRLVSGSTEKKCQVVRSLIAGDVLFAWIPEGLLEYEPSA